MKKKASPKRPRFTAAISLTLLPPEEADGDEHVVEIEDSDGRRRIHLDDPTPPPEPEPQA